MANRFQNTPRNERRLSLHAKLAFVAGLFLCALSLGACDQYVTPDRSTTTPHSDPTGGPLRELIVSYAHGANKRQLYRVYEDGSSRREITDGAYDRSMPAWSPDGKKIAYVQQGANGMTLWLSDPDGKNAQMLPRPRPINMKPSWLPDSKHIVWFALVPGPNPAAGSRIYIVNIETMQFRRLFTDPEQLRFGNLMPAVSPDGKKIAFVSNRSGEFRIWVSNLDGSHARPLAPESELDPALHLPYEQKVPAWSPDGSKIAFWQGVEMDHMSQNSGRNDPRRDELISRSWNVWVIDRNGRNERKAGHGDDPTWSPDGFLTRSFPDPSRGGANVMIETPDGWRELPILPPRTTQYGQFTWKP